MQERRQLVYGPVPSRRLGQSMGVNNIPPKVCSYSCIYCQLGPTIRMRVARTDFERPEEIVRQVRERFEQLPGKGGAVDYVTFVADGEPTLDCRLGESIDLLKRLGTKVAVISNASLLADPQVRQGLSQADWVSLKVDAVDERTWRRVNRPHRSLNLLQIHAGAKEFSIGYRGELTTETMLLLHTNDSPEQVAGIADFVAQLHPSRAYLSVPTRPPAIPSTRGTSEEALTAAYEVFASRISSVECLTGYEGNAFASTGDARTDLLDITAVHPMREEAVQELVERCRVGWAVVQALIGEGKLKEVVYQGKRFYLRTFGEDG